MSYILGEDMSNMTIKDALELKAEMPEVYMAWAETKKFVHATRRNVTEQYSTADQKSSGQLDFSLVARAAEKVGERFGSFQDNECRQIKASLAKMEERGTGRVPLSEFYKVGIDGQSQFSESIAYLRQLGALDESDPWRPRIIIANYISSPSNCIASSNFYSVCCMDECEGLLGHLERQISAPEATSTRIAALVSELSSSSVAAPWKLSASLLARLGEIAAEHGGSVPLHGRLFGQWMHHAFPRECPFPHLSGTTNPQTPDEWLESTGEETTATDEEMQVHVNTTEAEVSRTTEDRELMSALPWSPEEELLVARPQMQTASGTLSSMLRSVVLLVSMVSVAYGVVHSSQAGSCISGGKTAEKYLV